MAIVRTERRERGFVGHLFKRVFIGFNLFMIVWLLGGLHAVSKIETHTAAEQIGGAIGAGIGVTMLLMLWGLGDLILGVLVLLTRGNKIIIEETASASTSRIWPAAAERPAFDLARVDQRIAELKAGAAPGPAPRVTMASPVSPGGFGKRRA